MHVAKIDQCAFHQHNKLGLIFIGAEGVRVAFRFDLNEAKLTKFKRGIEGADYAM